MTTPDWPAGECTYRWGGHDFVRGRTEERDRGNGLTDVTIHYRCRCGATREDKEVRPTP
ncbi:hypothetical protein [Streptomonospora litoralis]|uniref:Uncharacterized protein n=1 Tax=Streptomonospora litoralis TaxID=2498135 RepID=A0A4P6Q7S6_9ACTN|nr:hypothetical protein [Streptomonospora litoralis]QBI56773.1 hypothetical protein EKD16_25160 [Streptomonospora litoralis]